MSRVKTILLLAVYQYSSVVLWSPVWVRAFEAQGGLQVCCRPDSLLALLVD